MQTVDIIILAVLFIPGVVGLFYGFLNIAFSIAAWIVAFAVTSKFSGTFSPLLTGYVDSPFLRNILAFIGLFIITLMIMSLAGFFVVKLLGKTGLTVPDRILGFLLGLSLGGFIVSVVVFLAGFTAYPREDWWRQSIMLQPFVRIAVWGSAMLPENVAKYHNYAMARSI
jgi:membrane protein required for colicin V production